MLRRIKSCKHRIQVNSCRDSKRKKSKLTRVSIPFDSREEETNIRNNRVSVFSRSDGVNLGCGAEQSHERNAIESRQRRNPRGGCKIRIVALSRIMKRSTRYVTLSERERERDQGPIPARSSVQIARSITNEDERREPREEHNLACDSKEQRRWISLVATPLSNSRPKIHKNKRSSFMSLEDVTWKGEWLFTIL